MVSETTKMQKKSCPSCKGTGILDDVFLCGTCSGKGYVEA